MAALRLWICMSRSEYVGHSSSFFLPYAIHCSLTCDLAVLAFTLYTTRSFLPFDETGGSEFRTRLFGKAEDSSSGLEKKAAPSQTPYLSLEESSGRCLSFHVSPQAHAHCNNYKALYMFLFDILLNPHHCVRQGNRNIYNVYIWKLGSSTYWTIHPLDHPFPWRPWGTLKTWGL